jgi:hypothetical protein
MGDSKILNRLRTYQTYYTQYDTNPYTGNAWTLDEINDLQVGVDARSGYGGCGYVAPRCTQIYTEINYTNISTCNWACVGACIAIDCACAYAGIFCPGPPICDFCLPLCSLCIAAPTLITCLPCLVCLGVLAAYCTWECCT